MCPYKGLATYQASDAALFAGRGRLVTHLVARLVDSSLLVVSGPSGAGKSSVVRAGLVPALAGGALPGSEGWRAVVVTPGRRPVDALTELTGDAPPEAPVVLVCDQLEEIWAAEVGRAERTAFLDTLLGLLDDGIVVRCVVVVRGDHVERLAEHATFTDRVGSGLVLVPALTDDELREVVEEPAAAVGLAVDPDLVDAVVADVRGRPGALPLLSTALVGTWEARVEDRLSLAGYIEAGGVAGALTRSAESAYALLDEQARTVARRLLVRLADTDEGGALVRRPAPLAELDLDGDGGDSRRAVIESFVARRLLTVDGERLDVTHEALLTSWPRLAGWLDDDAAGRAVRRHLTPVAQEWHRLGEPQSELYRGPRLAAALDWAAAADTELTAVERGFLDASKGHADRELREAQDRARTEARARRRTRRLAAGLAVVLVAAVVAAVLAVGARRTADRTSLVADANRLAALSATVDTLDLQYLLAAEAFRLADTPETQDGLLSVLAEYRRAVRAVPFPGGLHWGKLGNGGRTLFIAGVRGIHKWEIESGELPRALDLGTHDWSNLTGIAASPTEAVAATVGVEVDEPWFRMIDAEGTVRPVLSGDMLGGTPIDVSFTADGRLVDVFVAAPGDAAGGSQWRLLKVDPTDGTRTEAVLSGTLPPGDLEADISEDRSTAVVWSQLDNTQATILDLGTGAAASVSLPDRGAEAAEYRALESGAAQLWLDGAVTLHDRSGRVTQQLDAHDVGVSDVALAPDGTWAATVDNEGGVVLWDIDPGTGLWSKAQSLARHGVGSLHAEITPDSGRLVTMSRDTAIVWDLRPDGGFGTSQPGIPGRWMVNPPEVVEPGRLVVAPTRPLAPGESPGGGPGTAEVAATFVDPRTGEVVEEVPVGDTDEDYIAGASVAVSEDGRSIAVTSSLATYVIDARTREVITTIDLTSDDEDGNGAEQMSGSFSAAWTKDGARLLLGNVGRAATWSGPQDSMPGGDLVVVDTATWNEVNRVAIDVIPEDIELDPSGRFLVAVSPLSPESQILDADTLDVVDGFMVGLGDRLLHVSFSPNGRLLAGAGIAGGVHIIDTRTWEAREPVVIRDTSLRQVEWLPDNRTVVVTGEDGTVSVFDAERMVVRAGRLPASPGGEAGYTKVVPDLEHEIVAINAPHAALRYPTDPEEWLKAACAVVSRDLTRAEWDRYLPGREYGPTCTDLG
jgi:WD40 repeat protein